MNKNILLLLLLFVCLICILVFDGMRATIEEDFRFDAKTRDERDCAKKITNVYVN
jgi:hypothetical protein